MKQRISWIVLGIVVGLGAGRLLADEIKPDPIGIMYSATGDAHQTQELVKIATGLRGPETGTDTMAAMNVLQNQKLIEQNAEIIALLRAQAPKAQAK